MVLFVAETYSYSDLKTLKSILAHHSQAAKFSRAIVSNRQNICVQSKHGVSKLVNLGFFNVYCNPGHPHRTKTTSHLQLHMM